MSRVQSIERAFAVLGALTDGPIGVTEVADRVDLPKSTAARMLASLAREGAVEQVPGDTRYRLGPRIESLATGLVATRSVVAIARPHLVELAAADRRGRGAVRSRRATLIHYIDQVDTDQPVGVRDWTGSRIAAPRRVVRARRPRPPAAGRDRALSGAAARAVHRRDDDGAGCAPGTPPQGPARRVRVDDRRVRRRASRPWRPRSPTRAARRSQPSTSTARRTASRPPAPSLPWGLRSRPPPPGSPGGFVRPADLPPMAGRAMAPGDVVIHGVSYQKRW